jgi:hypothetical protein
MLSTSWRVIRSESVSVVVIAIALRGYIWRLWTKTALSSA